MLVLAGAPLGNPGDASPRLRSALAEADVVAAEDTRRLRRLASDLDVQVRGRVVSYFEGNESARTPELVALLQAGSRVLLITDGGMPSVSDPGYRLVAAAVAAEIPVTVVPGPSAVTTALAVSGLASDRFVFEGFLPRKGAGRRTRIDQLAGERRTMVFFESPHRLAATLQELALVFGAETPAAACRELTKTYEEVRRGSLEELATWAADGVKGEVTLVVAGRSAPAEPPTPDVLAREVALREEGGDPRKEAIAEVAKEYDVPKRQVFDAVVASKGPGGPPRN